jgi:endoglucanase
MRILKQLSEALGVSGEEGEVREVIRGLIENHVDDIQVDTMGNLLAFKQGTSRSQDRMTVLIDAHMDEVGLIVSGYTSDGMLKVKAVGGLDDRILPGKRVLVGPDRIPGVIGVKPVHLLSGGEYSSIVRIESLRVDIGVASRDAASGKAPLGARIAFDTPFMDLGGRLRGKAFDDRAGCAVLVHILQGERYPFDLVGAFVVQEEVGLRGARVAAHRVRPDAAFVLEGTIADDLPKEDDESPTTELDKGPALSVMDRSVIYDKRLNQLLIDTAEELGIDYQFKQPGVGGTDGGAITHALEGIPAAAISVPCRYIHSPAAMCSKRDYRNAIKLLGVTLGRLDRSVLAR